LVVFFVFFFLERGVEKRIIFLKEEEGG